MLLSGVPIFIEHWGDNLQFYPNFAQFSTLGEINLDHNFVQVSKLNDDQKKKKVFSKTGTLFLPNSGEDQKKKRSSPTGDYFFPRIQEDIHARMHTRVKLLGEMQM